MLKDVNKKYRNLIKELETRVENKEDIDYFKNELNELYMLFVDNIDIQMSMNESKILEILESQRTLYDSIDKIENVLNKIEKDIYLDNEDYDFEIVCPYCNYEFFIEMDKDLKKEVICPECKNSIELDWEAEDEINMFDEYFEEEHDCDCHSCHSKGNCHSKKIDLEDDLNLDDNDEEDDM